MRFPRKRGSTSQMIRIFIPDNSVTTGAGLTGLTNASTNLTIEYIRELDSAVVSYSGANIEAQTTIGTFQAPSSSSKIRFKETPIAGLYELQFHDSASAFGAGDASQHVVINIREATTSALKIGPNAALVPLVPYDPQDSVRMGLTALPNAAAEAAGGLFTRGTGAGQINQDANGRIDSNLKAILGTVLTETAGQIAAGFKKLFDVASPVFTLLSVNQTGDSYARLGAPAGASIAADIAGVQSDTDNIQTRIPAALVSGRIDASVGAIAANAITATAINADAITAAKIADGAIDAATFAAGAIDSAAIAADAIGSSELAASAVSEIQTGLATSSALATAQADLDDIQTRLPSALTADGNIKADTLRLGGVAQTGRDVGASVLVGDKTGFSLVSGPLDAAGTRAAVGLATANLDTQLDALPTNAELATALAGADDATLAAIAALNNLSQANVRSALGMSSANLDTQLATIAGYIDTEESAIKAVTDKLNTMLELSGSDYRFTVAALSQAPAGGGGGGGATAVEIRQEMDANSTKLLAIKNKTDLISVDAITVTSPVTQSGAQITLRRGSTLVIPLVGLGSLAGREKLYFTVKSDLNHSDGLAKIQIEETAGLLRLAGATVSAGDASVTVDDEDAGDITVRIEAAASAQLVLAEGLYYDVKKMVSGDVDAPVEGRINITGDVTRSIA